MLSTASSYDPARRSSTPGALMVTTPLLALRRKKNVLVARTSLLDLSEEAGSYVAISTRASALRVTATTSPISVFSRTVAGSAPASTDECGCAARTKASTRQRPSRVKNVSAGIAPRQPAIAAATTWQLHGEGSCDLREAQPTSATNTEFGNSQHRIRQQSAQPPVSAAAASGE